MSSPLTAIIIDGHPIAFGGTIRDQDPTMDRTQMLPPIPWWTCMVDSTLEFCRIGWGTASKELPEISVISAGEQTKNLVSFGQAGHIDKLIEGFKHVQPRQTTSQDRIQTALDTLFQNNLPKNNHSKKLRIVLLLLSKGNEDQYSHYNNEGIDKRDIRAILYSSFKDSNLFDSIHVDILRLFPFTDGLLPNIENTLFAPSATLSIYNIPNRSDSLKITMRHLAQMYYNVDILRISNIPMNVRRQDGSTAMTQTVEFYTRCIEPCYSRQHNDPDYQKEQKDITLPIYDPRYLESKVIQLSYVKRNKRVVNDMGWCICKRLITSLTNDGPTKTYLGTILQGSVSYLIDLDNKKNNKEWTHILIAEHDKVLLHVFDYQLENELKEKTQMINDKSKVKVENPREDNYSSFPMITPDKVQEFMQMFIHPNMYQDIFQLPSTKKFEVFKYSSQEPLLSVLSRNNNQTTFNMELTTRWHTCFRDSMGTDMFPVILEDNRPISDFANEVCNGTPLYSGFGLISALNLPLNASLNKIKNALFLNDGSQVKIAVTEIDIIVNQLSSVLLGKSMKMISNVKMIKEDSRLMAKRLLIALYLIGTRFMENGPKKVICKHILSTIHENTMNIMDSNNTEQLDEKDIDMEQSSSNNNPNEIAAKEASLAIEAAWNQAKKFESMTVREQSDSRYSLGTNSAIKNEDHVPPIPMGMTHSRRGGGRGRGRGRGIIRNETPERNISVNPNFMRHETGEAGVIHRKRQVEQQKQQPAIPYLLAELAGNKHHGQQHNEGIGKQEKNSFGPPGSFLDLYWNVDKQLREGKQGEEDGKVITCRDSKWQRIQKEFDGRMGQQQQQHQHHNKKTKQK
ncbi:hypothetical protein BDC45DRAFT_574936 [Circinella umbellata]|nr:hypothetical protein BDC45DRAFT_574936 [Circinella umbellata]